MGGFYTDGVPNDEDVRRQLSDVEKLRIAAMRTHLSVAADTREMFSERLSRLRNAYIMLAARRQLLELPEYATFVTLYNDVRSKLAASLHPGRELVPPRIRA